MKIQSPLHKYLLSLPIFGLNGIVAAHILMPSYEVVLLRTLLGSLALLFIYRMKRKSFHLRDCKKDSLFVCLSGIMLGLSWLFLFEAYRRIGVGTATMLYYCGPMIVVLASPIVFREKLTLPRIFGLCLVIPGIILIQGTGSAGRMNSLGILCGFTAAIFYSLMLMLSKFSHRVIGLESSVLQLLSSFLVVAVYVGCKTHFSIQIPDASWPWILILGFFNTALGCYLYFSPLSEIPAQTIAVCGYLEPLSAVVFSVLLLGETMFPAQIVGTFCIIAGACLGEMKLSLQKGAIV